jgi:hypothetical protein
MHVEEVEKEFEINSTTCYYRKQEVQVIVIAAC